MGVRKKKKKKHTWDPLQCLPLSPGLVSGPSSLDL